MKSWYVKTKDGNLVKEGEKNWKDIKDNIEELKFDNNGQIISLPKGMEKYIQAKTASADLNGGEAKIESRYIAFSLGNNTVRVRINEHTNNISIEID